MCQCHLSLALFVSYYLICYTQKSLSVGWQLIASVDSFTQCFSFCVVADTVFGSARVVTVKPQKTIFFTQSFQILVNAQCFVFISYLFCCRVGIGADSILHGGA